jgi:hypothetical protein
MATKTSSRIEELSEKIQIKDIKEIEKYLLKLLTEQQEIKTVLSSILEELKKQNMSIPPPVSDITLSTISYYQGIGSVLSIPKKDKGTVPNTGVK